MSRVLFTGGPVVTFDGPLATSLAVDGDRIVAIGDSAESWSSKFDEVVRLDGRALVPAFRDGHAHPLHAGVNRNELDLTGVRPFDAVIERVREWAVAHPDDPWIIGHCYDPTLLPRGLGQTEWLDAGDRPVVLFPTDYHALWADSAALTIGDVTASTPEPELGTIVRHGDGRPVGMLLEHGRWSWQSDTCRRSVGRRMSAAWSRRCTRWVLKESCGCRMRWSGSTSSTCTRTARTAVC